MTSFQDVLTYVATQSTDAEIRALFNAGNARTKVLRSLAAAELTAQLTPGTRVRVKDIRPKRLQGVTGVFVSSRTAGSKTVATLRVDAAYDLVPDVWNGELSGIPLSCLELVT